MTKLDLFAPFREQYAADDAKHDGPEHWRSLDHKARTSASLELLEQEFPHGSALPPADPEQYDDGLVAAVRAFQSRHGLVQDGVVGNGTRAAMNVPVVG